MTVQEEPDGWRKWHISKDPDLPHASFFEPNCRRQKTSTNAEVWATSGRVVTTHMLPVPRLSRLFDASRVEFVSTAELQPFGSHSALNGDVADCCCM